MNKDLKYYIFGLLSGMLFIPLLEEFSNVIMSWIQVLILKPSKLVLKGNQELAELQGNEEPINTTCIGFQAPNSEEYYDDYVEE